MLVKLKNGIHCEEYDFTLKCFALYYGKWRFKNQLKPVANLKHDYDCKGIM